MISAHEYWTERLRVKVAEIAFLYRCLKRAKATAETFRRNLKKGRPKRGT